MLPRSIRCRVIVQVLACAIAGCSRSADAPEISTIDGAVQTGADDSDASGARGDVRNSAENASIDSGIGASDAAGLPSTSTLIDSGVTPCDVELANHPPFDAIRKLATTRDEVRVLVYGQSISEQSWWLKTKRWLEETYPNGKLVMEQHAHGGCPAECLIGSAPWVHDDSQLNRLPQDVFAFRPDLIIFHVFGTDHDYEYVMKALKLGCAAFDDYRTADGKEAPLVKCTPTQRASFAAYRAPEVLVQNDFTNEPKLLKPCPRNITPQNWDCYMNERVIPAQVAKYGYTLQDNFHLWPKHISREGLDLKTLIADDGVHLREPGGTDLMFKMTIPHLCYTPAGSEVPESATDFLGRSERPRPSESSSTRHAR